MSAHGTRSRYVAGCRCAECRRAQREYQRDLPRYLPPTHGASGYVNYACRCKICKAAGAARARAYRERKKAREQC